MFKKYPTNMGVDTRGASLRTYAKSERDCMVTDFRLRNTTRSISNPYWRLIERATDIVAHVLGECDYATFVDGMRHGDGSAVGLTRPKTTEPYRWLADWSVTKPAEKHVLEGLKSTPFHPRLARVEGNSFGTVPKTMWTDRSIATEPLGNLFAQLSLGDMLRKRLLEVTGIDLTDQTHNQSLARLGSVDKSLSTIDLSSASDTISGALIQLLFRGSLDWYELLTDTRSSRTHLGGLEWTTPWKFSSMGNGFTFPLESLVFYAITKAALQLCGITGTVSVYGDDIICPSAGYQYVTDALKFCGFTPNESKSFTGSQPFRESCGSDWWNGIDVRAPNNSKPLLFESQRYKIFNDLVYVDQLFEGALPRPGMLSGTLDYCWSRFHLSLFGPPTEDRTSHVHAAPQDLRKHGYAVKEKERGRKKPFFQSLQYRTRVVTPINFRDPGDALFEEVLKELALSRGEIRKDHSHFDTWLAAIAVSRGAVIEFPTVQVSPGRFHRGNKIQVLDPFLYVKLLAVWYGKTLTSDDYIAFE
jgi:hypothetical protein